MSREQTTCFVPTLKTAPPGGSTLLKKLLSQLLVSLCRFAGLYLACPKAGRPSKLPIGPQLSASPLRPLR